MKILQFFDSILVFVDYFAKPFYVITVDMLLNEGIVYLSLFHRRSQLICRHSNISFKNIGLTRKKTMSFVYVSLFQTGKNP
jgi:hypothetical protein